MFKVDCAASADRTVFSAWYARADIVCSAGTTSACLPVVSACAGKCNGQTVFCSEAGHLPVVCTAFVVAESVQ